MLKILHISNIDVDCGTLGNYNMQELSWPEWAKSANIYEVNIRQYTAEGTLKAFETHIPRLHAMGVDILWFMPVFPISDTKRKGSMGSYYAPSTYTDINPQLGNMADFKSVLDQAHSRGMKVIIDWVPNHTGWDHDWITSHPDYYLHDANGLITEPLDWSGAPTGWTDVAQLDYRNAQMRQAMIADMMYWIEEIGIDGFRQDMALLVPLDFWTETTAVLIKAKPDIFLVAESEHYEHLNNHCFHVFYGWSWHHLLNQVAQLKEKSSVIDHWFHHTRPNIHKGMYMLFTSNHDENSWSGSEIERMGLAYKAMAVLNFTIDAIPLLYSGQEEPCSKRIEFFDKDDIGYSTYRLAPFYSVLMKLRHQNKALWHMGLGGSMRRIMYDQQDIFSFDRERDGQSVTVIINLSRTYKDVKLDRGVHGFDIFTGDQVNLGTGHSLRLGPWGYLVVSTIKIEQGNF
jgi:alpha-amylase